MTVYSCLLEAGIFLSHIIWLLRTRKLRKEIAAQGKTFDDVAAEHDEQGTPFKWAERKSWREKKRQQQKQEKDAEEGVTGTEPEPLGETSTPGKSAEGHILTNDGAAEHAVRSGHEDNS